MELAPFLALFLWPRTFLLVYPNSSNPTKPERTLAAIDVGTNSIHMVVVKVQSALPAFTIIDREKEMVRLGDFNAASGGLSEPAMQRGIDALQRCRAIAEGFEAEAIVAVATSAVREASNGRFFLDRVEKEVGLSINLISGQEEARRIYLGVLSGMEFRGEPHAIIDIGGGSTELILGTGEAPRVLSSTPVGAVRLTARFDIADAMSKLEFTALQAYVRGRLEAAVEDLKRHLDPHETLRLVGTSGTIECLAALDASERLGKAPTPLNGSTLSYQNLVDLVDRLRKKNFSERLAMSTMSARRAGIIVAGGVILQETMRLLGVETVTICDRALREGVVVDWMLGHGLIEDRMQFQQSVRERSVRKTAQKYQVNLEKNKRVADFAIALFDQTQGVLHQWSQQERELLWSAALLYNCGHFISHASHHIHAYYLIRSGELLGFTETELEVVANIARYHRKSAPKKTHKSFQKLPSKQHRQMVSQLSAILRVAVALDRRSIGAIQSLHCQFEANQSILNLTLKPTYAADDCSSERWAFDDKKTCFEAQFGIQLRANLLS